jgi:heme/copper-type cytochrome/quinol oxidase subunit 1
VIFLRHAGRLARDVVGYAVHNRAWWLLPVMGLLVVVIGLIVVGQAAAPYTLYTLF